MTPVALVAAVVALLVIPAATFPAKAPPPSKYAPLATVASITDSYATAPRCDGGPTPEPVNPSRKLLVQLEGNSIAGEIRDCLGTILGARNVALEGVNPPGFLLCKAIPAITQQAQDPATHPDAAILFVFVAYDPRCGQPWHKGVDELVAMWKKAGTHVYLVPSVPFTLGTTQAASLAEGPIQEAEYYKQLADADPAHITLLDAGSYIRDVNGNYVWRMPCLPGGEPGCDSHDTVGVRWTDGFHYCTDPDFAAHGCEGKEHQAGERRAAASVAKGLLPSLTAVTSKPGSG